MRDRIVWGVTFYVTLGIFFSLYSGEATNSEVKKIIEGLKSSDIEIKKRAIHTVGVRKIKEAIPYLIELLKSPDDNIRDAVVWSLGHIPEREYIMLEFIDPDKDIEPLKESPLPEGLYSQVVNALIKCLKDSNKWIRIKAILTLGTLEAKEAVVPLRELLTEKDRDIVGEASLSIGVIKPKLTDDLKSALEDAKKRGIWQAEWALKRLSGYKFPEMLEWKKYKFGSYREYGEKFYDQLSKSDKKIIDEIEPFSYGYTTQEEWYRAGYFYFQQKRYRAAEICFKEALKFGDMGGRLYAYLAQSQAMLGVQENDIDKIKEAKKSIEKAIARVKEVEEKEKYKRFLKWCDKYLQNYKKETKR